MRLNSSLNSGWPGTMASGCPGRFLKADSPRSSLSPARRVDGSGPWQLKQLLARIGCTSLLKSTCCLDWGAAEGEWVCLHPVTTTSRVLATTKDKAGAKNADLNRNIWLDIDLESIRVDSTGLFHGVFYIVVFH